MKKTLLIDSNSLIYRAYHALPPLKNEGQLLNAVYGFFLIFTKAIEDIEPDFVLTTFDRKEKTFRHEKFADYKAQRPDMPEDLVSQLPIIREGLKSFSVPCLDEKGYEADDIIATFSKKWKKETEIVILSGDRDLLQLVDDNVFVFSPGTGIKKMIKFDNQKIKEKYQISPKLFVDYKALRGDPSDNIPGIKGIGEKTAIYLVKKYGTVEDIFSSLDEIEENFRKKLEGKKDIAIQSKELVLLKDDLEIPISLEDAKFDYDLNQVIDFFKKINFKSLILKYQNKEQLNLDF